MGNMNVGSKSGAEWPNKGLGGIKGGHAEPTPLGPLEPNVAPPEPILDKLKPFLPMGPNKVEPCIGLDFHTNPIEEIERIRTSKGMSQVQALMEFKEVLSHASDKGLEKAQAYLTDEMAKPYNNDDEMLGSLLKAVNHELNERHDPKPFNPIRIDPKPDFPTLPWHPKSGGGNGRVLD